MTVITWTRCTACGEDLANGYHSRGTKACMAVNPEAVARELVLSGRPTGQLVAESVLADQMDSRIMDALLEEIGERAFNAIASENASLWNGSWSIGARALDAGYPDAWEEVA